MNLHLSRTFKFLLGLIICIFIIYLSQQTYVITNAILDGHQITSAEICKSDRKDIITSVPNIIHLIWLSKNNSRYPLKNSYQDWSKKYPQYTVKIWRNKNFEMLINKHYPDFLPLYSSYTSNVQRADMARLMIVHHEGGFYSDMDAYPLNDNLDELHTISDLIFLRTSENLGISNHFFMASQNHSFLKYALDNLEQHHRHILIHYLAVFTSTGPLFIGKMFREWLDLHPNCSAMILDNHYVYHDSARSWHQIDGMIINFFGDYSVIESLMVTFAFIGLVYFVRKYI